MRGGLQIYPRVLGVCPKLNLHDYPQGICGMNGVSETFVHIAAEGVIEIDASRSFGYFATAYDLIKALDFLLMVVDWGR